MAEPAGAPVVALFGPTGMGKTEIAVALAEALGAEIVSADSMQVYRGLAIVTNQPSAEQLARVPHHLVGVVDPRDEFSAARFAELARGAVDERWRAAGASWSWAARGCTCARRWAA